MLNVAIIGASGYTGLELLRYLINHENITISILTSRQYAGRALIDIFPSLHISDNLTFQEPDPEKISNKADLIFLCVPHGTAMKLVPQFLKNDKKVIDLSADFRIKDPKTYEKWYQVPHLEPTLLKEAVYGLSEIYREKIKRAKLVANPGCYPTGALIPLIPLLKEGLIETKDIIIDSKSGVSGAGRTAKITTLFCEINESFRAYNVAIHRHVPEIEQELSFAAGTKIVIQFTPHLIPMSRGILTTIYTYPRERIKEESFRECLKESYKDSKFIRILPSGHLPNTVQVRGSNYIDIGLVLDSRTGRLIILSAIDNLVKGASGQAIQNMNIMYGWPEERGLKFSPLFP